MSFHVIDFMEFRLLYRVGVHMLPNACVLLIGPTAVIYDVMLRIFFIHRPAYPNGHFLCVHCMVTLETSVGGTGRRTLSTSPEG